MKATEREKRILSESIIEDRIQIVTLKARVMELEEEVQELRKRKGG